MEENNYTFSGSIPYITDIAIKFFVLVLPVRILGGCISKANQPNLPMHFLNRFPWKILMSVKSPNNGYVFSGKKSKNLWAAGLSISIKTQTKLKQNRHTAHNNWKCVGTMVVLKILR